MPEPHFGAFVSYELLSEDNKVIRVSHVTFQESNNGLLVIHE